MNHVIKEILKATFLKKYRSIALLCVNVLTAICTLTGRTLTTIEPLWLWIIILGTFIISSLILWRMFLNQVSKEFDNKEKFVSQQETKINELKNTISGFRDYLSFIYCLIEPFSAINKINRKDNINEETLQKEMLLFCTRLKEAFEHLDNTSSGRVYSVSIKVATKEADIYNRQVLDDLELRNSFRDTKSFWDANRNEDLYQRTRHLVSQNTAYRAIINYIIDNANRIYYVNNDVLNDKNYKSSSQMCYAQSHLPYASELVIPIIPLIRTQETIKLLGFMCITSNLSNGFVLKEKEFRIMLFIADSLYNLFSKWQKKAQNPQG